MTLFNIKSFKTIAALGTMVFFVSCSNDIATSADGLINNSSFVRDTINIHPVIETEVIDSVPSNLLSTYLVGDYTSSDFGTLNAGFVGQVVADTYPVERTDNDTPADVTTINVNAYLEIPIAVSLVADETDVYELANALGDISTVFDFEVSTFETYLERFNANGDTRVYYSNGKNDAGTKEKLVDPTELGVLSGYSFNATYEEADTLRIPLDSYDFKTNFLDALDSNTITNDDEMRKFFKGVKFEATKVSGDGLVVPFDLGAARLKIEYTNQEVGKEDVDEVLSFSLNGALHNLYSHDHANANQPNEVYVQGASGYHAKVDISEIVADYSVDSKNEEWLINQAMLKVYIKEAVDGDYSDLLSTLHIYAVNDEGEAVPIKDYSYLGASSFVDGIVRFNDTENRTDPYVRFLITKFIKDALADGEISELRIKESRSETTFVDLRSTTAKGLVLLNDVSSETKAPILELIYSKINE
ncbi:DUF4270 family protein [Wenyingzhuangia aestuarii]|uniref:DUF4270 family protein n=1 Tax=Wenyingzhuangia aestuarii TaxID=1647582 RepID=UPI00143C3B5C|nr:DUF4270 family protein [Wenyingzhuangia aestuarii]NJB82000.1 hypothetical protein [Wenyingzhuangia aestuarii]